MRVLVTGAAGFIGSHLCQRLVARGIHVVGLDNFDSFYDPEIKRRNLAGLMGSTQFDLAEADIRDEHVLHRIMADADPRNEASLRVMARLGMRAEGEHRETLFLKGEWVGATVWAILEGEWRAGAGAGPG